MRTGYAGLGKIVIYNFETIVIKIIKMVAIASLNLDLSTVSQLNLNMTHLRLTLILQEWMILLLKNLKFSQLASLIDDYFQTYF